MWGASQEGFQWWQWDRSCQIFYVTQYRQSLTCGANIGSAPAIAVVGGPSLPGAASNAPDLGEQSRTQDLTSSGKLSERHRLVHVQLWYRQAQGGLLCRSLSESTGALWGRVRRDLNMQTCPETPRNGKPLWGLTLAALSRPPLLAGHTVVFG